MIGRAKQRSALVELQRDVALKYDGGTQINAGSKLNRATAFLFAGIDSILNSGRIFARSVAFGAIGACIADQGRIERTSRNGG